MRLCGGKWSIGTLCLTENQVCFISGTEIVVAQYDENLVFVQYVTKTIEEIQVGDVVLAKDQHAPDGDLMHCVVVNTFVHTDKEVTTVTLTHGVTGDVLEITGTSEHPFYVTGKGFVNLSDLELGDECVAPDGSHFVVTDITPQEERQTVYNFEVQFAHTYYVGSGFANAVLVHNQCTTAVKYWPSTFEKRYLGKLNELERRKYAMGCVGVSIVTLHNLPATPDTPHLDSGKFPHLQSGAHWFQTYDDARKFYLNCRISGKKPALMMVGVTGDFAPAYGTKLNMADPNWFSKGKGSITLGDFDYCILANIDIGKGKQPCWIHAQGEWHTSWGGRVVVTPVAAHTDTRRVFFVVIDDVSGRTGLNFDINFDIPAIPTSTLPKSITIAK